MASTRLFSLDDLLNMPPPKWLVEGMFEANSLVMVAGAPGSLKSFLALDWILSMTTGRKWHGREVIPSKVLYILGEGKSSLLKRIHAWYVHNKCEEKDFAAIQENMRVMFDVPQLALSEGLSTILTTLAAEGFCPTVIVIDTFARSFVGKDENSSLDTGLWIKSAEDLRNRGYGVIFLHHTRKNTEFGPQFRGSTAISGAMDTNMTVVRDYKEQTIEVAITKQKDHDEGEPLYFRRTLVQIPETKQVSCALTLVPRKDRQEADALRDVLEDPQLNTLNERAKALAVKLDIKEETAKSRIRRHQERLEAIVQTSVD